MGFENFTQLKANSELGTLIIELVVIVPIVFINIILILIKKKYKKLTQKGFSELILGFSLMTLHRIFDLLDTIVVKKINGEKTFIYTLFDILDAVFSFVALFIIGYAFLKIAQYGIELWEEES